MLQIYWIKAKNIIPLNEKIFTMTHLCCSYFRFQNYCHSTLLKMNYVHRNYSYTKDDEILSYKQASISRYRGGYRQIEPENNNNNQNEIYDRISVTRQVRVFIYARLYIRVYETDIKNKLNFDNNSIH